MEKVKGKMPRKMEKNSERKWRGKIQKKKFRKEIKRKKNGGSHSKIKK